MTYKLNERQFASIQKLSDHERFDYFLKKVADWEEVWSLCSSDGWVELSTPEGEELFPVWPHPDFAEAWAVEDWSDCQPKAIKLDIWLERWVPGLERDSTLVTVFPVDEEGAVMTASELEESLLLKLEA